MTIIMRPRIVARFLFIVCMGVAAAGAACQQAAPPATSRAAEPDPKNELPFGFVDAPPQGAGVGRQVQMYGWALDDQGVADVRVFVDGKYVTHTGFSVSRPDVAGAHPTYTHGNDKHGWAVTVALGPAFAPGAHTILVQAVDTLGATRDIGSVAVSVAE